MEIFQAEEKHIPEIVGLWEEMMEYHRDMDYRFPMRKDAASIWGNDLRGFINSKEAHVLVAQDAGDMIGFVIAHIARYPPLFEREQYGIIDFLMVTSQHRRSRIGEKLVSEIHEWFDSRDISVIELRVEAKNSIALSFWRNAGFKDHIYLLFREVEQNAGDPT